MSPQQCCSSCTAALQPVLECGNLPLSARYRREQDASPERTYPLNLWQCNACGLLQLLEPVAADLLKPPFPWITYRDPEAHLNKVAQELCTTFNVSPQTQILAVGPASEPLLNQLKNRGITHSQLISASGLATTQAAAFLKDDAHSALHGKVDLVIALHVLEHTRDLPGFLAVLKRFLSPQGKIVLEVPDSAGAFESLDASVLWEDHAFYFTSATLTAALTQHGFTVHSTNIFEYTMENSLVVIAGQGAGHPSPQPGTLAQEITRARAFASGWRERARSIRAYLIECQRQGPIALFGAGHRAIMFANLLGPETSLNFCIDDDANKRGLMLPGSGLPIFMSQALIERAPSLCLLAINPDAEDRVKARFLDYTRAGGRFESIYPASRIACQALV